MLMLEASVELVIGSMGLAAVPESRVGSTFWLLAPRLGVDSESPLSGVLTTAAIGPGLMQVVDFLVVSSNLTIRC